ncbi:hypothetical protein KJ678_02475 [Patescibacteria group bacterium]|nr:hypothetical protein [Patescibacteria group bacterium]
MKNSQKGFIVPLLLVIIAVLVVGGGVYIYENKKIEAPVVIDTETESSNQDQQKTDTKTPSQTPTPSPIQPSTKNPTLSNNCENLVTYSAKAYQDGWEKTFKKENNLSDSEFNAYITVSSVSLRPLGLTCELEIRYAVKKDWLLVNQIDSMTLGVPPTISPSNLPLESDPTQSGRIGVSTVNLHDSLSFKSQTQALNYYVSAYNLKGTGAKIQQQGFQNFWNKESAEKSGYPFAGEGGEAFISVSGTINQSQNKCYRGELSLVTKETTYHDMPCWIN